MAEQIISPGVFTRENDLTFLPQGVGAIGAAIIGPTTKGPAFVPTVLSSFSEFERRFGGLSSETYIPQTVREYLRNAGSVTVCRVLAGGGYTYASGMLNTGFIGIGVSGSQGDNVLVGAIFPSKNTSDPGLGSSTIDGTTGTEGGVGGSGTSATNFDDNFNLLLTGSNTNRQYSASLNPNNSNYLFKQLGTSPFNSKQGTNTYVGNGFTYLNFKSFQTSLSAVETTKETVLVTFPAGPQTTQSLANPALEASGALFLSTDSVEGAAQASATIVFDTGSAQGGVALDGVDAGATGSVFVLSYGRTGADATDSRITFADTDDGGAGFRISGSALALSLMHTINNSSSLSQYFTASVLTTAAESGGANDGLGLVVQIESTQGGALADARGSFDSLTAVTSVATSVQGSGQLSNYTVHPDSNLLLITQSADITFNGNLGQTEGYSYASTPMITSQFLDDNKTVQELFQFHSLDHGKVCNKDYKVSISNLKEPGDIDGVEQYSTFSVLIRKYNDKDKSPVILEQFNDVNLDVNSTNYICRVIGDRFPQYNDLLGKVELLGNYPNISNLVRVSVRQEVTERALSPKLSPKGFKGVSNPIPTASLAINVNIPSASYEGVQQIGSDGTYNSKGFLGWKFTDKAPDNDNFTLPLPTVLETNVAGNFNVEDFNGHADSGLFTGSLSASIDVTGADGPTANQLKFTVCFQGGEDGIAHHTVKQVGENISGTNVYGFDLSATNKAGYTGYKKAIDILSNQDEYDINMLSMPGVIHTHHPLVTNLGIDMVEERGDAFFVMDLTDVDDSVNTAVSRVGSLDTNYAAVYYPWVKVLDDASNKPVLVPPSVIVPGAIAASDRIGAEWFAPAGLNRGILGNVLEAKIRLNQAERDILYNNKINPIATFPQTGVCIWGQKTLQERPTALDRINVRRLLITLKKFIASSSRYLVFEQNTLQTRTRFLNIVNPYLESVQQQQGLFAFRVQMDEGNNTPSVIDRNQLVGAIFLQPTKTAEFIVLDFNVMPTGATFDGAGGGATGGGAGTTGGGGGGY